MAIQHLEDHNADVIQAFGLKAPTSNKPYYGVEVELGWSRRNQRDHFFSALSEAGLDNYLKSKHDGTIQAEFKTEMVTRPHLAGHHRTRLGRFGDVINRFADQGMITEGCGVHIHVNDSAWTDDQLWRVAQAICQDPTAMYAWSLGKDFLKEGLPPQVREERRRYTRASNQLHRFWNYLALREQNDYCGRGAYNRLSTLKLNSDHTSIQSAFIHGRNTNTFEFRFFRTPRSKRLLTSFFEVVLALRQFSLNPHVDLLDPLALERRAIAGLQPPKAPSVEMKSLTIRGIGNWGATEYTDEFGNVFTSQQTFTCYLNNDETGTFPFLGLEPRGFHLPALALRYALDNGFVYGRGALYNKPEDVVGWKEGIFPLADFIKFILKHKAAYPNLASRMTLPRFRPFGDVGSMESTDKYTPQENHLEFRAGCLVTLERSPEQLHEVDHLDDQFYLHVCSVVGDKIELPPKLVPVGTAIHCCPGALEKGGES